MSCSLQSTKNPWLMQCNDRIIHIGHFMWILTPTGLVNIQVLLIAEDPRDFVISGRRPRSSGRNE